MADNNFGFKKKSRGDLELVYATHMGNSTNPATGEVLRLQMGWDSMGEPYYIMLDGSEWIPSDEYAIGAKPTRISLGSSSVSLDNTTQGLTQIPTYAKLAQFQVLPSGSGVAWGTTGSLSVEDRSFFATSVGGTIDLQGEQELLNFVSTSLAENGSDQGSASQMYVEYFNIDNKGNYVTYLDNVIEVAGVWIGGFSGVKFDGDFITKADGRPDGYDEALQFSKPMDLSDTSTPLLTFDVAPITGSNPDDALNLLIGIDNDHTGTATDSIEYGISLVFLRTLASFTDSGTQTESVTNMVSYGFEHDPDGSGIVRSFGYNTSGQKQIFNNLFNANDISSQDWFLSISFFSQKSMISNIHINGTLITDGFNNGR